MRSLERETGNSRERKGKMKKKTEESGAEKRRGTKLCKPKSWEQVLLLVSCNKRGFGPTCSTPVVSWKHVYGDEKNTIIKGKVHSFLTFPSSFYQPFSSSYSISQVSARKLAYALWEFQQYFSPGDTTMYKGYSHLHRLNKDEQVHHYHRGGSPDHHQPASADSLRRHIAALLIRHHQSAESNKHALQPLSPASYGSSLEMAPYNPAATPDSSIELRGRIGESSYSFKTSTELLKVLNRIWSLEEQHASNISLIKALKHELDHARSRIKGLLRDQQANRHEIDELLKQVSEDNLARKSKEKERIDSALQSVRIELEDERKLRKRSESLHRKLARELFEVKVSLSTTVKDLEKERNSNALLEQLCDEFALGIKEYAGQMHAVRQTSDKNSTGLTDHDEAILHISESWLDHRVQMQDREAQVIPVQKSSTVDKLRHKIEAFLTERQITHPKESHYSLESIPEAASAPQCIGREGSSMSDSRRVEITKAEPSNDEEQKELALSERIKSQSPISVQTSDPQNAPPEADATVTNAGEQTPTEISMLQKSDVYDSIKENTNQRNKAYHDEGHGSNSKTIDKRISELLLSEGGSFPRDYKYKEVASSKPVSRRNASPVRQWMASLTSPDPRTSESSTKVRDTLKAKLQEPKPKGQRSRLKILKGEGTYWHGKRVSHRFYKQKSDSLMLFPHSGSCVLICRSSCSCAQQMHLRNKFSEDTRTHTVGSRCEI